MIVIFLFIPQNPLIFNNSKFSSSLKLMNEIFFELLMSQCLTIWDHTILQFDNNCSPISISEITNLIIVIYP